jgi:recombination protein RecR
MRSEIDKLIDLLTRLPGVGQRSAVRIALHLLKNKDSLMKLFANSLLTTAQQVRNCDVCGNFSHEDLCNICQDNKRDDSILCVVEDVEDLWAIEKSNVFRGKYHILGGTLSAMDNKGPDDLNIAKLLERVKAGEIKEVIIATNATVDGQTTAFYLTQALEEFKLIISKLAHGLPLGSELGYIDDGTMNAAFTSRHPF